MKPGQPARVDYEYERNGTANLFMLFAPLEGWRHVKVTDRRTAVDYAQVLKDLSDIHFPGAERIVLVQDNLNTHAKSSLYEAFPAAEAELAILFSQCLDRRIPDKPTLEAQVAAWMKKRNTHNVKADWQFTSDDARIKLKHLYPSI